jgi:short-subunit dehydrogenase
MNIKDKVVIVTGASSGIGKATAQLLSKSQAKVVLAARSKIKLEKLSKELQNSLVVVTDMRDENQIKELVKQTIKHFGRVDILINNAGRGYDSYLENIDTDKFRELFALNLIGPVVAMKEVIPYMKKQNSGVIINLSSGTALMAIPGMSPYSSLKRALVGISLTAREELAVNNISVSVIYPYITSTDFEKNTMKEVSINNEEGDGPPMPGDPPEYIAEKILELIKSGKAESFAHDWMGKPRK